MAACGFAAERLAGEISIDSCWRAAGAVLQAPELMSKRG